MPDIHILDFVITAATLKAVATAVTLVAAMRSFIRERIPPDLTALLALCALLITGVLTPVEAFSGFSHPATISVAAVLMLSAGIERTGILDLLARRVLARLGRSELLFTLVMMLLIGTLSAFINNTAAVAIFIPVVLDVCRRTGIGPGRVLMPMAHAATIGGMCTLVGTSTNLVAHEFARAQGLPGFSMFELGKIGVPMALVGFTYILLVGRLFLPKSGNGDGLAAGQDGPYLAELVLQPHSSWIGRKTIPEAFHRTFDLELLGIDRGKFAVALSSDSPFESGDLLHVRGSLKRILALSGEEGLEVRRPTAHRPLARLLRQGAMEQGAESTTPAAQETTALAVAEVVVLTPSGLIGETLTSSRFAERHDTVVLALRRRGNHRGRLSTTLLRAGDVLVLEGGMDSLNAFAEKPGFLVIGAPAPPPQPTGKLLLTLLTMAAVIAAVSFGLAPIVTAAVAGSAALMLAGCLKPREAYESIDLGLVCLLAGSLGLGLALEKTGITGAMAQGLSMLTGIAGPYAILVAFFVVAVLISEFMSNSGTVALLGPIALSAATQLHINPMSLMAAVMFGSSAAFAMPIGYQTSLMIYGPGGYRFIDFVRMGIVLDVILAAIALWLIPSIWPLAVPQP